MSNTNRRYQQPAEWTDWPGGKRSRVYRSLSVILVVGLIVGLNFVLFNPTVRGRAEYVALRIQTYAKKLRPHPLYVPTPSLPTREGTATAVAGQATATPSATRTATPTVAPTPTPRALPSTTEPTRALPLTSETRIDVPRRELH